MEKLDTAAFKEKVFDYDAEGDWKYKGALPLLIDFYADWCGPCKAFAPILEEIEKKYQGRLEIYKVDIETSPEIPRLFRIRSIPGVLFVPLEGKPTMATGLIPKEELVKAIKEILSVDEPEKN